MICENCGWGIAEWEAYSAETLDDGAVIVYPRRLRARLHMTRTG